MYKVPLALIVSLLISSCTSTNNKKSEMAPLDDQYACQGLGIMAEEIAEYRDSGLDMEKTFYAYIEAHSPPKEIQPRVALLSKEISENKDIGMNTFHYVYHYVCLASMKGISTKISTPYLIQSARRCEDNNERKTMISGCIQMAYTKLVQESQ
jgi:hypothetical protein